VDGFCLWNTAQTDYNVVRSPYGRDVLAMLADACHRRGFPLCLYYSLADMHHPNYPNEGRPYELPEPDPGDVPNLERYLSFVREQVRELCTLYGEISGFWWDANVIKHHDPSFNEMIRALQPNAVINNRGPGEGDFSTPERDWDDSVNELLRFEGPVEACQSVGTESWGYRVDEDFYSDRHLLESIDKVMAKGGNYLLNAGPKADGTIPQESAHILRRIGAWYRRVKEAFEGTEPVSGLIENRDVLLTRKGKTVYVHLFRAPSRESVLLKPMAELPREAILLNTGQPVEARVELVPTQHREKQAFLRLRRLPVNERANTVLVVKMEFD
jgi:alpha-L-fucosidase